jgi:endonuclease-8
MPEGPSIVILKEAVQQFAGKKILEISGNSKIEKEQFVNKKVIAFKSFGKHFLICMPGAAIRIHFLLFGSYSINENIKPPRSLRLHLRFANGSLYLYTCSAKILTEDLDSIYDWSADVMNKDWDNKKAFKKLRQLPPTLICDALLDQNIFAGSGNIIKEVPKYSFDFLEWKKQFQLKKHWLAHTKKICLRCDLPLVKKYLGKTKRRSFFCDNCQIKFN